jgi:hypothetical protein
MALGAAPETGAAPTETAAISNEASAANLLFRCHRGPSVGPDVERCPGGA